MDFNEASEYLRLSSQELEEERINQALSRMDSLGNLGSEKENYKDPITTIGWIPSPTSYILIE